MLSIRAHEESVLGLFLSEDGRLLFSSGGDSVVSVCTEDDACRFNDSRLTVPGLGNGFI